ncbi:MAG: 1-phosphofructokinase [Candidatus Izimaplasma sp.]|nr:1-phosphofructokinase [Candidatus Izimaplasma bacterium]
MIYTCTLSPAIDYKIELEEFQQGKLNRSKFSKFSAGGKGINISIVLNNLDTKNVALGFIGGFTGKFIENHLQNEHGLKTDFIELTATTRINVKLLVRNQESEINQLGPSITQNDLEKLLDKINTFSSSDLVICAGSQGRNSQNTYYQIAKRCDEKGIDFIIDTSKETLLETLQFKPLLVKPNIYELMDYFDVTIKTESEIIKYGKQLINLGAQTVIVSLGAEGSLMITKQNVYKSTIPPGEVKNTVGAGDSMISGFVSEYHKTKDLIKAYKNAVAAGTATAYSYKLATKNEIKKYEKQIELKKVNYHEDN